MMLKRITLGAVIFSVIAAISQLHNDRHLSAQNYGVTALTATVVESMHEGHRLIPGYNFTKTIAIATDGSKVDLLHGENTSDKNLAYAVKSVTSAATREHIVVWPDVEARTTYPLTRSELEVHDASVRARSCGEGQTPSGKMLDWGVVIVEEVTRPQGEGAEIRTKSWRAPELGCFPMREEVLFFSADGNQMQRTVRMVTSLALGEPEPWLFEIPPNYGEASPSEVRTKRFNMTRQPGVCRLCQAPELDEAYNLSRGKQ